MQFDIDFSVGDFSKLPVIEPDYAWPLEKAHQAAWLVAGDINGDGQAEIVTGRVHDEHDIHHTVSAAAYDLAGQLLWTWGHPEEGHGALHSDVACQIHDWDGEGRRDVIVAADRRVVQLDGATGREKRSFPIPPDASDCITFASLSGKARSDILVKTRYGSVWAFDCDGRELWRIDSPAGGKTCHHPIPLTLAGETVLMLGYGLFRADGSMLWNLPEALAAGGHLDCVRVLRDGATPAETLWVMTLCKGHAMYCVNGLGQVQWKQEGEHFESADVGHVAGASGPQIVVDVDHCVAQKSPLHVYDAEGRLLGRWIGKRMRQHALVRWNDAPRAQIVSAEERLLLDGETGQPVCRFETPVASGVEFDQRGRSGEHVRQNPYLHKVAVGDLTGNGCEDLVFYTNPGGMVWVFLNPASTGSATGPVGTGENFTLY